MLRAQHGWPRTRRVDAVLRPGNVKSGIQFLLGNANLLLAYLPSAEVERLSERIRKLLDEYDESVRHKRFTHAVQQFLTQPQWFEIRKRFYRNKQMSVKSYKAIQVHEDVWRRLCALRDMHGYGSLTEVIDALIEDSV